MSRKMKDSGIEWIGEIPEDWEIVRNKNLFVINKNMVGDYFADYQLLSLTTKGVKEKDIDNPNGKLPESFSTYQVVNRNDIILCLFDIDVSAVFSGISDFEGMITSAYKIVKCEDMITPSYADYWFKFVGYDRVYKMYSKSLRYTINSDDFGFIGTVVPPLNQQIKIANFLDKKVAEIDHILEKTRESIEEYKKYKQSIITEAVTKGLNPDVKMKDSGIEWIGKIPEHWEITRLKNLLDSPLKYGANSSGITYDENLPRYIRITDVTLDNNLKGDGKLSLPIEEAEEFLLTDNDILFARSGATVGKTFLYKEDYGLSAFAGYLIKASVSDINEPEFIYYYTLSSAYNEWKNRIFIQATIQNIGANKYSNMEIVIPSNKDEQIEIVKFIQEKTSHIDNLISKKEQLLSDFEAYKKSLIYECVTGKREVV